MMKIKGWYKKLRRRLSPLDERTKEFDKTLADESYILGYTAGHKTGLEKGFETGQLKGHDIGYEQGYLDGRQDMAAYMTKEA